MLAGMKILCFTHYVQGPAAAQYLADMGAEVIKVEPLAGAWERHRATGGSFGGASATYVACNRNKRSIAVDLKHPEGRELLLRLVERADVVAENYRAGVLDRLGLGYEDLRARKPDIIYASATGWGASGPMRDAPGQDLLVQARSGLIATTGPHHSPTAGGAILVDQHGAALFAMGILGAYVRRLKTGVGGRVEASLLSAALDLQMESLAMWSAMRAERSDLVRAPQLATWLHDAPYGVYELADCHVAMSLGPNVRKLPEALGSEALIALGDVDRRAERDRYAAILAAELKTWTWERLDAALAPHGLWYARVAVDLDEVMADPQVAAAQSFSDIQVAGRTLRLLNHPVRYDGDVPGLRHIAWHAGQDTQEVLLEAGFTSDEVARLARRGVISLGEETADAA
jgi:crotonobetainyl-CoA:carnitine CoA-transferase CaiB-like acyl-CoA transferase